MALADDDWSAPCDCVAGLHCHSFLHFSLARSLIFWTPQGDLGAPAPNRAVGSKK